MNNLPRPSLPYPDTDGIMKNPALINPISAARVAELGDISDYIYFSLMLEETHPMLSELFDKMAMTEMRHFWLLGKMIIRLGGDPAVRTRHSNPFYGKPERIDCQTVRRIVSSALEGEQSAMKNYLKLAATTPDKAVSLLLERIAADEEHHARMLSCALDDM